MTVLCGMTDDLFALPALANRSSSDESESNRAEALGAAGEDCGSEGAAKLVNLYLFIYEHITTSD